MVVGGQIRVAVAGVRVGLQHSEGLVVQQGGVGGLPRALVRPRVVLLVMAALGRRVFGRPHRLVAVLIGSAVSLGEVRVGGLGRSRDLLNGNLLGRRLFVFVTQATLPGHAHRSGVVRKAGARL